MTTPDSKLGKTVLMIAHVAGLVDLVALPIWVGVLMQHYGFGPERAGAIVTMFLLSVAISSTVFAPRFNRMARRPMAAAGYGVAALAFVAVAFLPVSSASFLPLGALHVAGGVGIGCGLSFTHGAMGRSRNPHVTFAMGGMILGAFAFLFLGGIPPLLQATTPTLLFFVFAALMALAAVCVAAAFPAIQETSSFEGTGHGGPLPPIGTAAWLAITVAVYMNLNQAMVFAFVERIGMSRDFGVERVNLVLLAVGIVNLTPALFATLLQKRLAAQHVGVVAPVVQTALAIVVTSSTSFLPYAVASSVFVAVVLFTQIFLFGLIARLDPSGRASAATPAMLMLGSGLGPVIGGVSAQASGYAAIGWAVGIVSLLAVASMSGTIKLMNRARALDTQAAV